MLTSEQVAQFQRDGFLLGGKVLTDETVDLLNEEVARVIRDRDVVPLEHRGGSVARHENGRPQWAHAQPCPHGIIERTLEMPPPPHHSR